MIFHQNVDEMKLPTSSLPEEGHKTINLAVGFKMGNGVSNVASESQVDDSTKRNFSSWKCLVEFGFSFEQPGGVQAPCPLTAFVVFK